MQEAYKRITNPNFELVPKRMIRIVKYITIHSVIMILCFLALQTTAATIRTTQENPVAFKFIVSYPVTIKRGDTVQLHNLRDTLLIVHYNDITLYRLIPYRDFKTNEKLPGTEEYFVRKKTEAYGKLFKTLTDSIYTLVAADSFLSKRAFSESFFEPGMNDKLIKTIIHSGIMEERYVPIKKTNEMLFDSTIYYYSLALVNLPYSFNPKLDRTKKAKLYKVRLIYNKYYSKAYGATVPKREYLFELQKVKIDNLDALLRLVKII